MKSVVCEDLLGTEQVAPARGRGLKSCPIYLFIGVAVSPPRGGVD